MGRGIRVVGSGRSGEAPGADSGASDATSYLHQLFAGEESQKLWG